MTELAKIEEAIREAVAFYAPVGVMAAVKACDVSDRIMSRITPLLGAGVGLEEWQMQFYDRVSAERRRVLNDNSPNKIPHKAEAYCEGLYKVMDWLLEEINRDPDASAPASPPSEPQPDPCITYQSLGIDPNAWQASASSDELADTRSENAGLRNEVATANQQRLWIANSLEEQRRLNTEQAARIAALAESRRQYELQVSAREVVQRQLAAAEQRWQKLKNVFESNPNDGREQGDAKTWRRCCEEAVRVMNELHPPEPEPETPDLEAEQQRDRRAHIRLFDLEERMATVERIVKSLDADLAAPGSVGEGGK